MKITLVRNQCGMCIICKIHTQCYYLPYSIHSLNVSFSTHFLILKTFPETTLSELSLFFFKSWIVANSFLAKIHTWLKPSLSPAKIRLYFQFIKHLNSFPMNAKLSKKSSLKGRGRLYKTLNHFFNHCFVVK